MKHGLKMRTYEVHVVVVRTCLDVLLFGGPFSKRKTIGIRGYTLKDAKRRAGIT